jgi:hypothetical protein
MGEFKGREAERAARKAEALAPFVAAAMARKAAMKPLADSEIPPVIALGRQIAQEAERSGVPAPAPNPRQAAWREAAKASEAAGGS